MDGDSIEDNLVLAMKNQGDTRTNMNAENKVKNAVQERAEKRSRSRTKQQSDDPPRGNPEKDTRKPKKGGPSHCKNVKQGSEHHISSVGGSSPGVASSYNAQLSTLACEPLCGEADACSRTGVWPGMTASKLDPVSPFFFSIPASPRRFHDASTSIWAGCQQMRADKPGIRAPNGGP